MDRSWRINISGLPNGSTAQAKQLINYVSDEANRLQLAKSSYRNITDPANFNQLYDLFSNQSSKDELTAYVNSR